MMCRTAPTMLLFFFILVPFQFLFVFWFSFISLQLLVLPFCYWFCKIGDGGRDESCWALFSFSCIFCLIYWLIFWGFSVALCFIIWSRTISQLIWFWYQCPQINSHAKAWAARAVSHSCVYSLCFWFSYILVWCLFVPLISFVFILVFRVLYCFCLMFLMVGLFSWTQTLQMIMWAKHENDNSFFFKNL